MCVFDESIMVVGTLHATSMCEIVFGGWKWEVESNLKHNKLPVPSLLSLHPKACKFQPITH